MANVRFISKKTPAKTVNVGGYVFRAGLFYVVDEVLVQTLDQIEVSGVKVFESMDKAPTLNKIDLTNKEINKDGKLVPKVKASSTGTLLTIKKPDTTQSTDAQVDAAIERILSFDGMSREDLNKEAKARKLTVRSNMRDETVAEMLSKHDEELLTEQDRPADDEEAVVKV